MSMFCKNCGREVNANAIACMGCGCDPRKGDKFCSNCGVQVKPEQIMCVTCGNSLKNSNSGRGGVGCSGKSRIVAGLLAIFLGSYGAHEFYLGNKGSAIARLAVTCGGFILGLIIVNVLYDMDVIYDKDDAGWMMFLPGIIMQLFGTIEGIIYLANTDDYFHSVYIEGHKAWF